MVLRMIKMFVKNSNAVVCDGDKNCFFRYEVIRLHSCEYVKIRTTKLI
jgi:hypothetical protein